MALKWDEARAKVYREGIANGRRQVEIETRLLIFDCARNVETGLPEKFRAEEERLRCELKRLRIADRDFVIEEAKAGSL